MTKNIAFYFQTAVLILFILVFEAFGTTKKPKKITAPTISNIGNNVQNSETNKTLQDAVVTFGTKYLGTPYVPAGCSATGFDCSGFVYFVFQNFKIEVPRSSAAFENFGQDIPIDKVEKGDILVFLSPTRNVIGHIGIVSEAHGWKSDFIHATSGRDMQVIRSSLTNKGYAKRFVKAVRVIK